MENAQGMHKPMRLAPISLGGGRARKVDFLSHYLGFSPKSGVFSKNFDKKNPPDLDTLTGLRSVQPSGRIYQSKAKSQRIAAWELLYRVQHLGRYVSRLQTILHSDIAVKIPRHEDDRRNTKHHCDGSFFRPSSESGSAAVDEDHIHGPNINRLP